VKQVVTVFQVSVYSLISLSAVMLGLAEGAALPEGMTVPLAVLALIFVERRRLLYLPVMWANLLGIVAFVVTAVRFLPGDVESRVLALAHLLIYLPWIVLFQRKRSPQYWWMCALSILQVAVGAVLTTSGAYGMLLLVYLFLAIWTLSVFSLYQAPIRFTASDGQNSRDEISKIDHPTGAVVPADSWSWRRNQKEGPSVLRQPGKVRSAVQHDANRRWISLRFVTGVFATSLLAGFVAAAFFVLIPRYWIGRTPLFGNTVVEPVRRLTGFSENVQLGDIGEILESSERVLQVRLFDERSNRELDIGEYARQLGYDEPLFRGAVLETYRNDGRWSTSGLSSWTRRLADGKNQNLIRQEFFLEPIGTKMLFSMHPVQAARLVKPRGAVGIDPVTGILVFRSPRSGRDRLNYLVYSPQPVPNSESFRDSYRRWPTRIRSAVLRRYRQIPDTGLGRMTHLAKQVAGLNDTGDSDNRPSQRQMANRIARYLRDSGRFSYSLNASIEDPSIDPVEDFLFNRKTGHCEYFASASCLMLRAVGIPARLVNGFKGGRLNEQTGYFEVQQRHAHAWVEAYIDDRWIIVDATPAAARTQSVESMAPDTHAWAGLAQFARSIWSSDILHMDIARQQQRFYEPLRNSLADVWSEVRSHRSVTMGMIAAVKRVLLSPDRWFSWQGALLTLILLLVAAATAWICRRIAKLWSRLQTVARTRQRSGVQIEFYERFRRLCAARGLVRRSSQTQQEFAVDACSRLNSFLETCGLPNFPVHLVTSFYQIRFGDVQLDLARIAEINDRLTRLEQALKNRIAN